jgi:Phage tail protein
MPWPLTLTPPPFTSSVPPRYGDIPGVRYGYQVAPWDSPLSLGAHALIEYNGYVMNDRYQSDRIHVTQITGLDDPDVYDSRDPKPGAHGETVYDSWYRGRTIMLTGQVEAGNLGTYVSLKRDLKAAFAPLVESPMKFRWFDVYDSFDDPNALDSYTAVSGSTAGLTPSQGVLLLPTSAFQLLRSADARLWGDAQQTTRIVAGAQDATTVSLITKYMNYGNYVQCSYVAGSGSPYLLVTVFSGGVEYDLNGIGVDPIAIGQSIWLRARQEGDLVTAELWLSPPQDDAVPDYTTSAWLTGSDADMLGDTVLSQVGFGAQAASPQWALDDYRVNSLYPGDAMFMAKKLAAIQMTDMPQTIGTNRFVCAFQVTMRASNYVVLGATQAISQTLVPTTSRSPSLGFTFDLTFPLTFRKYTSTLDSISLNILSVNNRGTAPSKPKIIVYGALTGFSIENLVNGQAFVWNGTLEDGDYLVVDSYRNTIANSAGTNMLAYFDPTSDWLQLEPGWNDLYFGGSGYSGNTRVLLFARGSWM